MIATIIPDVRNHYPVLLSEIISIITPQYGGTFIDCTFGQGGYTKKILKKMAQTLFCYMHMVLMVILLTQPFQLVD